MSRRWNAHPSGPERMDVLKSIRDAGSSLQVSTDLRHRVLDGARHQLREDHAWKKALSAYWLMALLAMAVNSWADRWASVQIAATAPALWSTELSRMQAADDATSRSVLSWGGWNLCGPDDRPFTLRRVPVNAAP